MTRSRSRSRSRAVGADRYAMLERAAIQAANRSGASLWYVGRDYARVYADSLAGARAAMGGPIGLILDRAQGLGEEMLLNGGGNTADGWAFSGTAFGSVAGSFQISHTAASRFYQRRQTVPGKTYLLSAANVEPTAGMWLRATVALDGGPTGLIANSAASSVPGGRTLAFVATEAETTIAVVFGASGTHRCGPVSLREAPGVHAHRVGTSFRPLVAQLPSGYPGIQANGIDHFLDLTYVDLFGHGSATVIAGVTGALSMGSAFVLAQGRFDDNNPVYSLIGKNSTVSDIAPFVRNDAGSAALSFSHATLPPETAGRVLAVTDTGSSIARFQNGIDAGSTSYTRNPPYTLDTLALFARRRSTNSNHIGGSFGLIAMARGVLPAADRIAIERFAALLCGANYAV